MIDDKLLIKWRRTFHAIPEKGFTEYQTTSKIIEILKEIGLEVYYGKDIICGEERMGLPSEEEDKLAMDRALNSGVNKSLLENMEGGFTGVVAYIENGPGPRIACRFDIDCNEVQEEKSKGHLPFDENFISKHNGLMHACGHDGHIAIGLGLAKWLNENKDMWSGSIKLIFQPAEEGVKGAKSMVAAGILDDREYFLSGHIGIFSGEDTLYTNIGDFLSTSKFDVLFKGKSVHAGMSPHKGRNALLAASSAALQLHAISRHGEGATRINVGRIEAGSGRNVIADEGKLVLETRGETAELNEYMANEMYRIIEGIAKVYNVQYEFINMGAATKANSSEELSDIAAEIAVDAGFTNIKRKAESIGGSEDASFMMKRVEDLGGKPLYMVFGTKLAAEHHNRSFDFDEKILKKAVGVFSGIIKKLSN
jgi:aminobenzoyl-glutamate utilization protein A